MFCSTMEMAEMTPEWAPATIVTHMGLQLLLAEEVVNRELIFLKRSLVLLDINALLLRLLSKNPSPKKWSTILTIAAAIENIGVMSGDVLAVLVI